MGPSGLEPPTLRLSVVRSSQLSYGPSSQQAPYPSFPPSAKTRSLRCCSSLVQNRLRWVLNEAVLSAQRVPSKLNNVTPFSLHPADQDVTALFFKYRGLLRKEVIQPLVLERLPCYDFTPIIEPTFGRALLAVRLRTSGVPDSHGVTGGVYKARERIHRGMLIRDY